MVMASATVARAGIGARIVTGAAIIAAVMTVGGSQSSWADPPAAPIVYAKALNSDAASARLSNRVEFLPPGSVQVAPAPGLVSFGEFEGRAPASTGAIDLRPGAVRTSFSPAPAATATSRYEPVNPLVSTPSRPAFAEPYAGPPYQVEGKWYVPTYEPNYDEVGIASWYGPTFHGKASASGEQFDENAMTAAHPTLPIPSLARVTNLETGKSVVVRLNDRGPFVDDRIIDLSKAAGAALGMHEKGTAKVRVQYVGPAPAAPNSLPAQPQQVQVSAPATPRPAAPSSIISQPLPPLAPAIVAPPAPTVSAAPVQRGYFLQAGSFADLGNAHVLGEKLKGIGPVSVTEAQVNGSTFYRVMLGPWRTNVEALQAQDRLTIEAGAKSILVARLN